MDERVNGGVVDEDLSRADRLKRANEAFGGDPNTVLISNHINAGGGEFTYHYII